MQLIPTSLMFATLPQNLDVPSFAGRLAAERFLGYAGLNKAYAPSASGCRDSDEAQAP